MTKAKIVSCAKVEVLSRIAITFIFKRKKDFRNHFIREQNELIPDDPKILLLQKGTTINPSVCGIPREAHYP
jgi:hypothetical protein